MTLGPASFDPTPPPLPAWQQPAPSGDTILAKSPHHIGELHFRRLLDKLPAGAYMCGPDGLITYYNQRAVELWGRAPKLNEPEDRY